MKSIVQILIYLIILPNIAGQDFDLNLIASNLDIPVEMAHTNDNRLFILEKGGKIKIYENGAVLPTPFLDITSKVNSQTSERGLLGMAFSPNYESDHYFFVHYSDLNGNTTIARYSATGNLANPNSEQIVLQVTQPFSNHNGGKLAFGEDGYLYIGLGDGGSGGDPNNYAQNTISLLGKLLRIDVSTLPYTIPVDNPYEGNNNYAPEIYAMGLRNPWKFSFDASTGDIWIADVGQNAIEEINRVNNASGLNFGWRCYEGNNTYNFSQCNANTSFTFPVATYSHGSGRCSITGGYVYQGTGISAFIGKYLFGDYCSGELGLINLVNNSLTWHSDLGIYISSFGEDNSGNLYVMDNINGKLYRFEENLAVQDVENIENEIIINNPVSTVLKIKSKEEMNGMRLYTSEGQLILEKDFDDNSIEKEINISTLPNGIYLLEVQSNNNKRSDFQKLMIKH